LVGDDFQLPPPFDKGAFDILHYGSRNNGFSGIEALGAEQFINCSNLVMEPIVILVGDDFQLPPPFDKGAFDILHYGSGNNGFSGIEALGAEQFINCSNLVMELSAAK
jgi:hypothetical protein